MTRSLPPETVTWLTAFLDLPVAAHDADLRFWSGVTGYGVSAPRGGQGEFVTLVPHDGAPFLRVQRTAATTADGPSVHLDLHVGSAARAAGRAVELGARVVAHPDGPEGYVVLRSPGGFAFCLVHEGLEGRAGPARWPGGHASILDQVCLDIPPDAYTDECGFWSALTGWEQRRSASRPEFGYLVRPEGVPIRLLLQRLDAGAGAVRGHVDLACDDRSAEVARHVALGATVLGDPGGGWTVLRDPAGMPYCVTDRDPRTGLTVTRR